MSGGLCQVCQGAPYHYTCPRCEIIYCSMTCYAVHSSECTEAFYKTQVEANLKIDAQLEGHGNSETGLGDERSRLEGVLHQLNKLDVNPNDLLQISASPAEPPECDENVTQRSHDTFVDTERLGQLKRLALDGVIGPEHLTPKELQAFKSDVLRGVIPVRAKKPWWQTVVLEVHDANRCDSMMAPKKSQKQCHAIGEGAHPHLCCSGERRTGPNPRVIFSILQTLFAYVHMFRCYGGVIGRDNASPEEFMPDEGHMDNILETHQLMHISCLAPTIFTRCPPPPTLEETLIQSIENSTKAPLNMDRMVSIECLMDCLDVIKQQEFTLRALDVSCGVNLT
eukprot:GHVN01032987.1.p1 GENE.GHVN01032987.1~~GHVN01032987.1.p1  ORF type:complete len:338 (-),score=22.70 GHVN01032987.1:804-1817(-)